MKTKQTLLLLVALLLPVPASYGCPECNGFLSDHFKTVISSHNSSDRKEAQSSLIDKTYDQLEKLVKEDADEENTSGSISAYAGFHKVAADYLKSHYANELNTHKLTTQDFEQISSSLALITDSSEQKAYVPKYVLDSYNRCITEGCRGLKALVDNPPIGKFPVILKWLPPDGSSVPSSTIEDVVTSGSISLADNIDENKKWKTKKKIGLGRDVIVVLKRKNRAAGTVAIVTKNIGSVEVKFDELKLTGTNTPPPTPQIMTAFAEPTLWIGEQLPGAARDIQGSTNKLYPIVTIWEIPGIPANAKILTANYAGPADSAENPAKYLPDFSLIDVKPNDPPGNKVKVSVAGFPNNVTHLKIKIVVNYVVP